METHLQPLTQLIPVLLKVEILNNNGIRGKILKLVAFLDAHQPYVVAIQETKTDSTSTTSELFPETCM